MKSDGEKNQIDGGMNYSGISELVHAESGLKNYNKHIFNLFYRNFFSKSEKSAVVDFGAGIGSLSKIWKEETGLSPICVEIDGTQLQILKELGFKTFESVLDIEEPINFIFSSNVLEHIENDTTVLQELYEKLSNGGRIGIYVPAFQLLFSEMDTAVGHFRRYSRQELERKMTDIGFKIETSQYVDSIGFLIPIVVKIFGWNNQTIGNQKMLGIYDRYIFPISRMLDKVLFHKFLGKNLFIAASKLDQ